MMHGQKNIKLRGHKYNIVWMFVTKTEVSAVKYTEINNCRKQVFWQFPFLLVQVGRLLNENISIHKCSFYTYHSDTMYLILPWKPHSL